MSVPSCPHCQGQMLLHDADYQRGTTTLGCLQCGRYKEYSRAEAVIRGVGLTHRRRAARLARGVAVLKE